jgi:uncharacterized membrane protein YeiB
VERLVGAAMRHAAIIENCGAWRTRTMCAAMYAHGHAWRAADASALVPFPFALSLSLSLSRAGLLFSCCCVVYVYVYVFGHLWPLARDKNIQEKHLYADTDTDRRQIK